MGRGQIWGEPLMPLRIKETPGSVLWNYTTPLLMFATTVISFAWLGSPSRFVTRLTQIRRQAISSAQAGATASGAKEGSTDLIRFQHGGHSMLWGEAEKGTRARN